MLIIVSLNAVRVFTSNGIFYVCMLNTAINNTLKTILWILFSLYELSFY